MTTDAIDETRAQMFALQMVGVMNSAMLGLMSSLGHRTGLFDAMSTLPPSTSEQIADTAGLNERYVREWLGAMTSGKIVEYDPAGKTYRLPPEHAASLTRAAGPRNLAGMAQFLSQMGNVEDELVEAFQNGGGVPYEHYTKFQQIMGEESAQAFDRNLVRKTLPLIPGMIDRLNEGINVADIGCGKGHAINVMAKAFPNSRFTGYDFSTEAVLAGEHEAKSLGLTNAEFIEIDVAHLNEPGKFDLITAFDAIHDQAHPAKVLANISKALRPGGVFLMVDINASSNLEENVNHPLAPMMYSISTMHCMTVSLALDGDGLGTMWGDQLARQMLAGAGFTSVDKQMVEGDIMNAYYIARKD